jgi:hypothetical protein
MPLMLVSSLRTVSPIQSAESSRPHRSPLDLPRENENNERKEKKKQKNKKNKKKKQIKRKTKKKKTN